MKHETNRTAWIKVKKTENPKGTKGMGWTKRAPTTKEIHEKWDVEELELAVLMGFPHGLENATFPGDELLWVTIFGDVALREHQHTIVVDDGVQTVRDAAPCEEQ